ncbi:putative RING-H2 finger protein ATL21A [Bidens hawaiensis]|uniref:putative RING-H2 finger protein ATL21A n=1 Tax=Bidens hawaiensis TaxID=980011 RepID=UPI00404A374F
MDKITLRLLFSCFFLFKSIFATNDCRPASCSPTGPQVWFPFRIRGRQAPHCGFPGFDLSCTKRNRTILHLTSTRSYIVNRISYLEQIIYINPEFCGPNRIVEFSLTGTPFDFSSIRSHTFYNCSLRKPDFDYMFPAVALRCLDSVNYSVIAVIGSIQEGEVPEHCQDMAVISVPIRWYDGVKVEMELMWVTPFCRLCEIEGRMCGMKGSDGETACFGSFGGIRRSMYGLILAIVVSILICIVAVVWYIADKRREYNQSLHQNIDVFSITMAPRQRASTGLDMSIIESYTKTILGESRRLPKDDDTCPICLSKYEPKDTLRTIPECNHYFHAGCIDQWLKLNATCPICRNSP